MIDSSALVAILLREPAARTLALAVHDGESRLLGSPTRTEASIVVWHRLGDEGLIELRSLLAELEVNDVPFDRRLADLAADAYTRFGKGNHPARLNLGDCFTYAVAERFDEPVLCVGDDFPQTDIDVVPLDPS